MIDSNPKIYGLKHDTWRSSQFDFLNKATSIIENGGGFIFSELPTGCGKTVIPTMLSTENKVLALVQTLGLLDQYEREYGLT
jgi:superfamily II DNA or RNA helicase